MRLLSLATADESVWVPLGSGRARERPQGHGGDSGRARGDPGSGPRRRGRADLAAGRLAWPRPRPPARPVRSTWTPRATPSRCGPRRPEANPRWWPRADPRAGPGVPPSPCRSRAPRRCTRRSSSEATAGRRPCGSAPPARGRTGCRARPGRSAARGRLRSTSPVTRPQRRRRRWWCGPGRRRSSPGRGRWVVCGPCPPPCGRRPVPGARRSTCRRDRPSCPGAPGSLSTAAS